MAEARISSLMVMFIMVNTKMEDQMDRAFTNGIPAVAMKDSSWMVSNTAKALGERTRMTSLAINTWENTTWIKNMALASSHGNLETCIRVITIKMKEMGMGKCTLLMELCIKAIGSEVSKLVNLS